jgi:NAD(P)-dependent dehydrogenase (short-subunit alcohol dehydrogenase family)
MAAEELEEHLDHGVHNGSAGPPAAAPGHGASDAHDASGWGVTDDSTPRDVVVVTGTGGMGRAIARRLGSGRQVVLADASEAQLTTAADELRDAGYRVHAQPTDVASKDDVLALARTASELGRIRSVVHTAGVSPVQATPERIVDIDVVGTARVLDAFEPHVRPGTVAVCIASMAGTMTALPPDVLHVLATTPTDELRALPVLDPETIDPGAAYGIAKRANQVRVEAASVAWGRRGGRVVSVSPGVIATPMGRSELAGPFGDVMRTMIETSGTGRIGTPDDIAAAVEFLTGPNASFITGIDLRVDGGVVAAMRSTAESSQP